MPSVEGFGALAQRAEPIVGIDHRVGVEDPAGGPDPVLVLELFNTGCATSSRRSTPPQSTTA